LFRPPCGSFDQTTLELLDRLRMLMVLWTVDTSDYQRPGVARIVYTALSGARPGAIILMHDGGGDRTGRSPRYRGSSADCAAAARDRAATPRRRPTAAQPATADTADGQHQRGVGVITSRILHGSPIRQGKETGESVVGDTAPGRTAAASVLSDLAVRRGGADADGHGCAWFTTLRQHVGR
jgi:hypothetical protein